MSASNPLNAAHYLGAAHQPRQLPPDDGCEVAFAGRSNAGKSSALNALAGHNALARVSKTPGRTQQLVFFQVRPQRYLVDLPGYGYAKVPQELQAHWQAFLSGYFATRQALAGLIVVMDIRHPLKDDDHQMLSYAAQRGIPVHILLTKADKLSRSQQANTVRTVSSALFSAFGDSAGVQVFSAKSKQGVEQAREVITRWLDLAAATVMPA